MRAIEKIGITRDVFKDLYKAHEGFGSQFNKNHPTYGKEETFLNFLKMGSKHLADEEGDLVSDIINRG